MICLGPIMFGRSLIIFTPPQFMHACNVYYQLARVVSWCEIAPTGLRDILTVAMKLGTILPHRLVRMDTDHPARFGY